MNGTMIVPLADIYTIMMASFRASSLVFLLPIFSGKVLSGSVKAALGIILAIVVYPSIQEPTIPLQWTHFLEASVKEILAGLLMGLVANMIFYTVEVSTQIIGMSTGLSMGSIFDPMMESSTTPVSSLLFYFSCMVLFTTNMHLDIIYAFARSFTILPIGIQWFGKEGIAFFIRDTSSIFTIGLQMAAPVIAANFLINLTFAVLGKAAPRMNVFVISFAITIIVGLYLLMMTSDLFTQYIQLGFSSVPEKMLRCLLR